MVIEETFSDGFDSDFSNGKIFNSKFSDVGGDAVDFSGSTVEIKNSSFHKIRDKAISVGESSKANLQNLKIKNLGVGIASKDGSSVTADNITISDYSMSAAMTFIKKDFYGVPSLKGNNFNLDKINEDTFRAQNNTRVDN